MIRPPRLNFSGILTTAKHRKLLLSILTSLRPSLFDPSNDSSSRPKPTSTNNISVLDGLRGLACLIVFNEHFTYNFTFLFVFGYGNYEKYTPLQMPFIKILWSGTPMVSVFYMISGYVLSHKPLKQIRSGQMSNFHTTMTSSIFRRAYRLFLPTIIAILICGVAIQLGIFDYSWRIWNTGNNFLALHERPPPRAPNPWIQIRHMIPALFSLVNPWDWNNKFGAGEYDLHTWTIAVEFRASMILYLVLIGTSILKVAYRLATVAFLMGFCICTDRCDVLLFFAGMLVAETDMILKSRAERDAHLPSNPVSLGTKRESDIEALAALSTPEPRMSRKIEFAWFFAFLLGIYLLCTPLQGGQSTYGYMTLLKLMPPTIPDRGNLPRATGAILTVWSAVNCTFLQCLFTNRFSLYFGKISFALYLVHGNILKSLQYPLMHYVYGIVSPTGRWQDLDYLGWIGCWLMCAIVIWPITLWLSDLFNSAIDVRCVKFARWVEGKAKVED